MTIKGELIGCNTFSSKKGTDCFFGSLAVNYDNAKEPNGIGYKIIQLMAFGQESISVYKQVMDQQVCNTLVECTGVYSNGAFQVIEIRPDSKGKK